MKNLRTYGSRPYTVAVIHGGPGAPGEIEPVARELASLTGVLEPLQTKDSVEGQVQELREVLEKNGDLPVTLIGHSWGAWLGFILTARHPALVKKLILVGSGAFEPEYAENIVGDRLSRLNEAERIEAFELIENINDPATVAKDKPMARLFEIFTRADNYDARPLKSEALEFNYHINVSVWAQAEKLRASGELLGMGKLIRCPVVAVHGDYDPHLAEGVRVPLARVLKDFRFILLEKCGHEPWIEKFARDRFYEILRREMA
jgi:pimeloyl-ACP methyl ester carboxylesterase